MVYFIVLVLQLRSKSNRFLHGVGVKEKFKPSRAGTVLTKLNPAHPVEPRVAGTEVIQRDFGVIVTE